MSKIIGVTVGTTLNPDVIGGGEDGITPHIGDNGDWYIGETDTGVKAAGEDGVGVASARINAKGELVLYYTDDTSDNVGEVVGNGIESIVSVYSGDTGEIVGVMVITTDGESYTFDLPKGADGADGKSAYATAKENGYTGTEEEFAATLAQCEERLSVLESADTLRYKGTVPAGAVLYSITDKEVGDVYYVVGSGAYKDQHFYMWDGTDWTPLCKLPSTEVAQGDASPVTGGAVYDYVAEKVASVYRYKGSVDTYSELFDLSVSSLSTLTVGDVYNVISNNMNYAWDGEGWDQLGSTVSVVDTVSVNGTSPVTSRAIAMYVKEQIAAYDTDVMTVLGVDEE